MQIAWLAFTSKSKRLTWNGNRLAWNPSTVSVHTAPYSLSLQEDVIIGRTHTYMDTLLFTCNSNRHAAFFRDGVAETRDAGMDKMLDLINVQIRSHIWNSLFIKIKGKEGFRHTWFHHERDAESCMISRTPELRERILLFSHQVLFLILRGDERPPREILGHCGGEEPNPWCI